MKKIQIEISEDHLLNLRQFCFENRMNQSSAFSEILNSFFDETTLLAKFEMSQTYKNIYYNVDGTKKEKYLDQ